MTPRVLLIDDDADLCAFLEAALADFQLAVTSRHSGPAALEYLENGAADVVLTDVDMPGMTGLELCERIVADHPNLPVLVITALANLDTAVAAIRAGARGFHTKPPRVDEIALTLTDAARSRCLSDEITRLDQRAEEAERYGELIGPSPAMRRLYTLLERVADVDAPVLVTGESGTGKELVARTLHRRGPRLERPFVAVNCAALPEGILESELFGHVRGAFTDASATRPGLFSRAQGGTLFLDEIADLPLTLQPKLLRALQERTTRPVGGDREVPWNARIVAATNRDLEAAVAAKDFREDLYFRLNVVRVELPALRERGDDVLVLAQIFLRRFATATQRVARRLSPAAAARLRRYRWPGNVRELQNCIERAVALASQREIVPADLPPYVRHQGRDQEATLDPSGLPTLEEVERRHVVRVLQTVGNNRKRAARVLGIDRKTLYRKLTRLGITDDTTAG